MENKKEIEKLIEGLTKDIQHIEDSNESFLDEINRNSMKFKGVYRESFVRNETQIMEKKKTLLIGALKREIERLKEVLKEGDNDGTEKI